MMNVALTGKLEEFVNQKVASGQYDSADAVICNALWLLHNHENGEQEKPEELRREIAK